MTKSQEKYLFELFQSKHPEISTGKVDFVDRPDVIVTLQTGETIGVELTECIYDEKLMRESEYQIKFNEKVIENLKDLIPFKFHLDIDLDRKIPLKQNQIKSTIDGVLDICMSEFGELQPYESKEVEQLDVDWSVASPQIQQHFLDRGFRKLPKGISRIRMSRYDILTQSRHPESKGGVVPDFTQDHLYTILVKKEKTLSSYRICNQQWLVIGEGRDFYSYIDKIRVEKGFKTKFDKVFIYRRWDSEIVVLK
jgi:hypothetical protein